MKNSSTFAKTLMACLVSYFSACLLQAEPVDFHFYLYNGDATAYGHGLTLIDSWGQARSLGHFDGVALYEMRNPETGEINWTQGTAWEPYELTGNWHWFWNDVSGSFDSSGLSLPPGSTYYLYDEDADLLRPLLVDEGFQKDISFTDPGLPEPPMKVFVHQIKVLGKATFKSKARFDAPVRIAPAGDISMGSFTHEPAF